MQASNGTSLKLLAAAAARGGSVAQEELGIAFLEGSYGQASLRLRFSSLVA
jgi:hypothetical protein